MAGGASGGLAEEVRARVDIVEVISQYVALQPAGKSLKGLCPFHAERTPSFTVSPERQLFYCFGCGAGGNVFTFLMRKEGLSFPEALEVLARRAGIDLSARRGRRAAGASLTEAVFRANAIAQQLFEGWIQAPGPEAEAARRYLQGRGLAPEVVRRFGLGYAPQSWDRLAEALAARGVGVSLGVKAGLLVARRDGRGAYARFRGRITFPIRDLQGRILGFGGRVLAAPAGAAGPAREAGPAAAAGRAGAEAAEPKYLNSPETAVYRKAQVLYGLDLARDSIRRRNQALIVEGYMDVIALHQAGIDWAVASCGTSLTAEHGRLLARFAPAVMLAYDADQAGVAAAARAIRPLREAGLSVRVVVMPPGEDPDTLVRRVGTAGFLDLCQSAPGAYEFLLDRALEGVDRGDVEGKVAAVTKVLPILAGIEGPVEREALIARTAGRLGISERALRQEISAYEERAGRQSISRYRSLQTGHSNTESRFRAIAGQLGRRWVPEAGTAGRGVWRVHPQHASNRPAGRNSGGPGPGRAAGRPGFAAGGAGGLKAAPAAERELLRLLLRRPDMMESVRTALEPEDFSHRPWRRLYAAMLGSPVEAVVSDPEMAAVASPLLAQEGADLPPGSVSGLVRQLREKRFRRAFVDLRRRVATITSSPGPQSLSELGGLLVAYRDLRERVRQERIAAPHSTARDGRGENRGHQQRTAAGDRRA